MPDILILGTGKMARNIGLFFLRKNWGVTWASRQAARAEAFAGKTAKDVRRLATVLSKSPDKIISHVCTVSNIPRKKYDLMLECINEDPDQKRDLVNRIDPVLYSGTILASNSSSILPHQIHEKAVGLHFFYPVELTGMIEVIFQEKTEPAEIKRLLSTIKSLNLYIIQQNEQNAFAVNRLLLPMQNEAFSLLQQGYSAEMINACSKSDQIKIGQFELMDSIGLDVLLPAVKNYIARMPVDERKQYGFLVNGLGILVKNGKFGRKSKNGILMGEPLPWKVNDELTKELHFVENAFVSIFQDTCRKFVQGNQMNEDTLDKTMHNLFG